VFGRRLTALVLESSDGSHSATLDEFVDYEDECVHDGGAYDYDVGADNADDLQPRKRSVRFGDDNEQSAVAYLVDVKCR
jgi:hypothetical protein